MPKEGIIVDRRDILKVAAGGVAAALTGTSSQVYAQSTTAAAVAP